MILAEGFPGRIAVRGVSLETRWLGPGPDEAPTLVLLHEGLGSVSTWGKLPERLAAATGCGVFVYSRAGYGASDPVTLPRPLTYMHDEALVTLGPLLDAAGVTRAVLVGHSDGASIATIYAGGVEDHRISGLVLIAPHFFTEEMGIDGISRTTKAYETTSLRERLARHHTNVDVAFRGWSGAWLDPGFRAWDITGYLATIRVPVLLIQGLADQYGTLAQVEAATSRLSSQLQTCLLDGVGHAPHAEATETTLAAIGAFVAQLTAGETIAVRQ